MSQLEALAEVVIRFSSRTGDRQTSVPTSPQSLLRLLSPPDPSSVSSRLRRKGKQRESSAGPLTKSWSAHGVDSATSLGASAPVADPMSSIMGIAEPPLAVDDAVPELTHFLMRRSSQDGASVTASLPARPPARRPSILRQPNSMSLPPALRSVRFPPRPPLDTPERAPGDAAPAPPAEVLSRPLRQRQPTPAPTETHEAAAQARVEPGPTPPLRDILTRNGASRHDRMLVRVGWTIREDLPLRFDALAARRIEIDFQPWEEMAVVAFTTKLELWTTVRDH